MQRPVSHGCVASVQEFTLISWIARDDGGSGCAQRQVLLSSRSCDCDYVTLSARGLGTDNL
jgi:hypothetical protein